MTSPAPDLPIAFSGIAVFMLSWLRLSTSADVLGLARAVLMALGGLVVIAIFLVVAVAIVSGVIGMVEGIKKRRM